jgi:phytoene dehydrogenase-like protein
MADADAVVIGAGINGLVAANLLADAGWHVVVCEAQDAAGGACRSAEVTAPGFVTDLFSAFYPLAAASPVIRGLELERHGLRWVRAPQVLAHPTPDGRCAVLSTDPEETAQSLASYEPGDAAAWHRQVARWRTVRDPLLDALVATPFPPVRAGVRLARALGVADGLRFARFATLPVRRFAEEEFAGDGAGLLFAGNALHTDLAPEAATSAVFGWILAMLGQDIGFPVPEGGAGRLADALVARLRAGGGTLRTSCPVAGVVVGRRRAPGVVVGRRRAPGVVVGRRRAPGVVVGRRRVAGAPIGGERALGVRLADGTEITARHAVVADVDAVSLYRHLVDERHVPARLAADLDRFQWDNSTFKVNWALSGPIPWSNPGCAGAGTVHLGGTMDDLTRMSAQLARSLVPAHPFLVLGQMTTTDRTRSPAGTESAWAYLHVPQRPRGDAGGEGISGDWGAGDVARLVRRVERTVEAAAPGFGDLVVGRDAQSPLGLEDSDAALHRGALNGGTAALHQQLVFRPVPGLGRPETPVAGLYLGSMSAHPGGGVHGGPGAMAARVALKDAGLLGPARRGAIAALHRRIYLS